MRNTLEDIAQTLKEARERKGLSQRALAELADMPQSHISKIENGGVDLRLSSLVEIGRALDLEVALLPRKTVPAVQSIVRNASESASLSFSGAGALSNASAASRQLARLQENIRAALAKYPEFKEVAQLQRQVRELERLPVLHKKTIESVRKANTALKNIENIVNNAKAAAAIRNVTKDLERLRNVEVHGFAPEVKVKPAYSLEDDDG